MDYTDFREEPSDTAAARILRLAEELDQAQRALAECEEQLRSAQERVNDLAEHRIPEALDELGQRGFTAADGTVVKLEERVVASLPKDEDRRAAAIKWLEDNGYSSLVKRTFTITFGRDDEAWARQFERQMQRRKRPLDVVRKQDVHHSTLAAHIRELLGEGVDVPLETFQAHTIRRARITRR